MHDLQPITALGGQIPRQDTVAALMLTENPDLALASVAARLGQETACHKHLKALISAVPGPGECKTAKGTDAFWTSPDMWMVTAPFATHEDLAAQLKQRFKATASVTEQTDAWCCFDLTGTGVEDVMELLCPVPIRTMVAGQVQRTSIDHLGCFVVHRGSTDGLRIFGPRSSAGSLHHALLTAMRSAS